MVGFEVCTECGTPLIGGVCVDCEVLKELEEEFEEMGDTLYEEEYEDNFE